MELPSFAAGYAPRIVRFWHLTSVPSLKVSGMKASLACWFLVFSSFCCLAQQNRTDAITLDDRSSLDSLTAVRVVRSVTEVNLVFTVTRGRHLVENLRPEDLEIRDNGKPPARVTHFEAKTNLPLRLALVIDQSDSVRARFKFEQSSAAVFLKQVLRPGDAAIVVGFNQHVQLAQAPTGDLHLLSHGIKKLKPGGDTAVFDALAFAARCLAQMEDEGPVRRVIVLLSDGQEYSSRLTLNDVTNEALYAEASVFSITSSEKVICEGDAMCQQGEAILQSLSDSTGGEFLRAAQPVELSSAFGKIRNELRKEYAMSYRPEFNVPDGLFHSVTIFSRKGTRVHCRKGYYAKTSVELLP
jgi:Ca-activated chloride channel homolog